MKQESWFFEKINKTEKSPARLTKTEGKKKDYKLSISGTRQEISLQTPQTPK